MAQSRKTKAQHRKASQKASATPEAAQQQAYDDAEKAEANASVQPAPLSKKAKHKHTGKEIAVIVVSVIMVVSILLPSFAQIFASKTTTTSNLPQSYEAAAEQYGPEVDEAKAALEKNPDDAQAALDLGNAYYQWGVYARSYADSETQETESVELLQNASDAYTDYLNKVGSLDSDDAKTAAMDRAFCAYYGDDTEKAIELMSQLATDTNYAPAWANLGMMYQGEGDTAKAADAFQKGVDADSSGTDGVKAYCESQLESLKSEAQSATGGAGGLAQQLDGTSN